MRPTVDGVLRWGVVLMLATAPVTGDVSIEPGQPATSSGCDVVVVLGDSLESSDPVVYAAALAAVGFDEVAVWAGAGRALTFPDVSSNVLATHFDGVTSDAMSIPDHFAGIFTARIARWMADTRQPCWVIALGSNDAGHIPPSAWSSAIATMLDVVADDPVVWVNVWLDNPTWPNYTPPVSTAWNLALTTELAGRANVTVYDWADQATRTRGLLAADGVHATPAGQLARATGIATLLVEVAG